MIEGNGPKWLSDIGSLTQSMKYVPVTTGTISNDSASTSEEVSQDCIVMPICKDTSYFDSPKKDVENSEPKTADDAQKQVEDGLNNENVEQERFTDDSSAKDVNAVGQHVNTASPDVNTGSLKLNVVGPSVNTTSLNEHGSLEDMFIMGVSSTLEATHIESFSDEDEQEFYLGNIINSYTVPTTPNIRIHKDHPIDNVIGDVKLNQQALLNLYLIHPRWKQCRKNFCNSNFNRNKERLVAQGHRKEEGIDYKEVFAPVARIKAIRLSLAYASFMGFLVYQMDVKSAFLYGTIKEEVYVTQPPAFKDPDHPDKVYKVYVDDIIFDSTNKDLCTGFEKLMKDKFQMSSMGELTFFLGLQVQQKKMEHLPVRINRPLESKDGDAAVMLQYISRVAKLGPLMYLSTKSRPDNNACQKEGRDTKIPQSSGPPIKVGDEAVHEGFWVNRKERDCPYFTASSLEAEQDMVTSIKTQTLATLRIETSIRSDLYLEDAGDDSQYTYGPAKTQPSEPETQTNELDACDSNISTESSELVFEPVVNESHIEVQPKVWSDAPIQYEEYEIR
ncbi:putative ribonuclease H-like domain-containing protein [Tanacetum coccineum]